MIAAALWSIFLPSVVICTAMLNLCAIVFSFPPLMRASSSAVPDDALEGDHRPSKTQRKKDSLALQSLAAQLCELSTDTLKRMNTPDDLFAAIRETQRTRSHEGHRRQLQYLGKLMRQLSDDEVERLRRGFDLATRQSREDSQRLHALEQWRERLLEDDDVATQWIAEFPRTDVQTLRQLIRAARKERSSQRPPKAYRELFQLLKSISSTGLYAETAASTDDAESGEAFIDHASVPTAP